MKLMLAILMLWCSGVIPKWNDSPPTVLPILKKFMNAGLRVWVYRYDKTNSINTLSKISLDGEEGKLPNKLA